MSEIMRYGGKKFVCSCGKEYCPQKDYKYVNGLDFYLCRNCWDYCCHECLKKASDNWYLFCEKLKQELDDPLFASIYFSGRVIGFIEGGKTLLVDLPSRMRFFVEQLESDCVSPIFVDIFGEGITVSYAFRDLLDEAN